jgi:GAF domain-containing protein
MPGKVLVVDSDMAARRAAMVALLPRGFDLSVAESSFEALSVAQRVVPDLIVLGSSMTDPVGLGLVGRLFSTPATADIPVIVVADTPEQAAAADRAGARSVIPGPVAGDRLQKAVQDHIDFPSALPQAPAAVLNDPDRLALVDSLRPGPEGEPSLERFTALAAKLLKAPVSIVTLVEMDGQTVAGQTGRDAPGTGPTRAPLTHSFCQFAVTSRQPLRIDDSVTHPLVASSPAIQDDDIRAYLGVPLLVGGEQAVGALCVTDGVPRHWTDDETEVLTDLAEILTDQFDRTTRRGRHAVG